MLAPIPAGTVGRRHCLARTPTRTVGCATPQHRAASRKAVASLATFAVGDYPAGSVEAYMRSRKPIGVRDTCRTALVRGVTAARLQGQEAMRERVGLFSHGSGWGRKRPRRSAAPAVGAPGRPQGRRGLLTQDEAEALHCSGYRGVVGARTCPPSYAAPAPGAPVRHRGRRRPAK